MNSLHSNARTSNVRPCLRARLAAGDCAVGVLCASTDATLAELLAASGWDYLLFDGEHGALSASDMPNLARACELHGTAPLVRLPGARVAEAGRYLDAGAAGLMAPMVESAADAALAVTATHYPPLGRRGVSVGRSAGFGLGGDLADHLAGADEAALVIAQIETAAGVMQSAAIAAEPNVDVVFIGPADLSASLGHPMAFTHPEVIGAVHAIARATHEARKTLGILIAEPSQAALARELGARFIAVHADTLIGGASRRFLEALR